MANYTNSANERAYDWGDTIERDSTFALLPEGVYPFVVTQFERGRYGGGNKLPPCNKAVLTVEIDGGSLGVATVTHNLYLHSRCEGLLCAFFTSIGLRQPGQQLPMPWEKVPGARGLCEVGIRDWVSDRTGQAMKSNEIVRFFPPSPESSSSSSPASSPLAAPSSSPASSAAPSPAPSSAPSPAPAAASWTPGAF